MSGGLWLPGHDKAFAAAEAWRERAVKAEAEAKELRNWKRDNEWKARRYDENQETETAKALARAEAALRRIETIARNGEPDDGSEYD